MLHMTCHNFTGLTDFNVECIIKCLIKSSVIVVKMHLLQQKLIFIFVRVKILYFVLVAKLKVLSFVQIGLRIQGIRFMNVQER